MIFWVLEKFQAFNGRLAVYLLPFLNSGNVRLAGGVKAIGVPLIRASTGARIEVGANVSLLSSNMKYHAQMLTKVKLLADRPGASICIGEGSRLNGACVHAWESVRIGKNCLIAANVQIIDSNGHAMCMDMPSDRIFKQDQPKPIEIGDNVWIGLNSIILPGTKLGNGCVVAAGSVVKGTFEGGTLVAGVPARVIHEAA